MLLLLFLAELVVVVVMFVFLWEEEKEEEEIDLLLLLFLDKPGGVRNGCDHALGFVVTVGRLMIFLLFVFCFFSFLVCNNVWMVQWAMIIKVSAALVYKEARD